MCTLEEMIGPAFMSVPGSEERMKERLKILEFEISQEKYRSPLDLFDLVFELRDVRDEEVVDLVGSFEKGLVYFK